MCLQSSINDHLKLHELKKKEKQFKCGFCTKPFFNKSSLKFHQKCDNKYECDVCVFKVSLKDYLQGQLIPHLNPHAYQCEFCNKTLTQEITFLRHIKSAHANGKKFIWN